jgi:hypothetical protein
MLLRSTFPVRPRLTLRVHRFHDLRPSLSFPFLVFLFSVIRLLLLLYSASFTLDALTPISGPLVELTVNGGACIFAPRVHVRQPGTCCRIHLQFPGASVLFMMNSATISVDPNISVDIDHIAQSAPPFHCFWLLSATLSPASAATLQHFEGLSQERSRITSPCLI